MQPGRHLVEEEEDEEEKEEGKTTFRFFIVPLQEEPE
jgi:hypothetical protein